MRSPEWLLSSAGLVVLCAFQDLCRVSVGTGIIEISDSYSDFVEKVQMEKLTKTDAGFHNTST
jgi:hypothetical protein